MNKNNKDIVISQIDKIKLDLFKLKNIPYTVRQLPLSELKHTRSCYYPRLMQNFPMIDYYRGVIEVNKPRFPFSEYAFVAFQNEDGFFELADGNHLLSAYQQIYTPEERKNYKVPVTVAQIKSVEDIVDIHIFLNYYLPQRLLKLDILKAFSIYKNCGTRSFNFSLSNELMKEIEKVNSLLQVEDVQFSDADGEDINIALTGRESLDAQKKTISSTDLDDQEWDEGSSDSLNRSNSLNSLNSSNGLNGLSCRQFDLDDNDSDFSSFDSDDNDSSNREIKTGRETTPDVIKAIRNISNMINIDLHKVGLMTVEQQQTVVDVFGQFITQLTREQWERIITVATDNEQNFSNVLSSIYAEVIDSVRFDAEFSEFDMILQHALKKQVSKNIPVEVLDEFCWHCLTHLIDFCCSVIGDRYGFNRKAYHTLILSLLNCVQEMDNEEIRAKRYDFLKNTLLNTAQTVQTV